MIAYIYWVRELGKDSDQIAEKTFRHLVFLVNKDRKIPITIAHIFVRSVSDVDHTNKPSMVIMCGAYPNTVVKKGVYFFRCIRDIQDGVVGIFGPQCNCPIKFSHTTRKPRVNAEAAD